MNRIIMGVALLTVASQVYADGDYKGDEHCPPPNDWSKYPEPYFPQEHKLDYPTFYKADWPGWLCSYQREDGVIVQYGDSRTPQEQWMAIFSKNDSDNN